MTKLKAKIISVKIFENNWALLSCEQGGSPFRANGTILYDADAITGVVCSLEGEWENHPRYGAAFKVMSLAPDGSEMFFFLSRVVKVGEKIAHALVSSYSDDELTEIMEDTNRHNELLYVKGIGSAKLGKIAESWIKYRHVKLLSDLLTPYGLTPNLVMRVFNHFGDTSVDVVRTNVYRLCEVNGIGFKRADDVALRLGVKPHDPLRLTACLIYVMSNFAEDQGNTLVSSGAVVSGVVKELDCEQGRVSTQEVESALSQLEGCGEVIRMGDEIALAKYYWIEKKIFGLIKKRVSTPPFQILSPEETEKYILRAQQEMDIVFSPEQAEAIRMVAAGHRTIGIAGLAGSGKSTLSKALINLLLERFDAKDVCCMALSGIAADRIRKLSGFNAQTIHSALGWKGTEFEFGSDKQLGYQVVVVDESSMINSALMLRVLEAVDRDACIIFAGDPGQLPPIGSGDVFRNLLDDNLVPSARLTKIYRQSSDSVLTVFASQIRQGVVPDGYLHAGGFKDFQFIEKNLPKHYFTLSDKDKDPLRTENTNEIIAFISNKLKSIMPYLQDPIGDFQILSPMKKGPLGTDALNVLAQQILNPDVPVNDTMTVGGGVFKVGDKVIHNQNKEIQVVAGYTFEDMVEALDSVTEIQTRRVFNGSLGMIVAVDKQSRELWVAYPEGFIAHYDSLMLSGGMLSLAYALTTHRVQGSEFKFVLLPMSTVHAMMLTAQLAYTSITRAKQKCLVVGQKFMFERCIKSLAETSRTTVLSRLAEA